MLLAIDAGNSNVTVGVFEGAQLRCHWRIRTETGRTSDEYTALLLPLFSRECLTFKDISGVIIASVVPAATPDLARFAQRIFGQEALIVTNQTNIGLEVDYQPPGDVGADRLVDAAAAVAKYGAPCIVIDFGSATTFNAIAAPRAPGGLPIYLGGAICLGIGLSLDALFAKAAKIPRVELASPPHAIGNNTTHALQSGILFGTLALVDGLVARFRAEMGTPGCPVIATGGYAASLIGQQSTVITAIDPLLTLDGLRLVYARNRPDA